MVGWLLAFLVLYQQILFSFSRKDVYQGTPGLFLSVSSLLLTLFALPHGFGGIAMKVKNKYPCTVHCRYVQGRLGTFAVCL